MFYRVWEKEVIVINVGKIKLVLNFIKFLWLSVGQYISLVQLGVLKIKVVYN